MVCSHDRSLHPTTRFNCQFQGRWVIDRRNFLKATGGIAATTLVTGSAHAKRRKKRKQRGSDIPVLGTGEGRDLAAESHGGPLALPAWGYHTTSAATDAMLMFRGNPTHTFYGTGPVPDKVPEVRWKQRMQDFESLYYGTPHVWSGTGWTGQAVVYGGYVFIGSQGRHIYAYEAETGKLRWRFETRRQVKASICLYDNKLYVGCVDDWLRCIDASTGSLVWKLDTGRDLDSSATVVDGRLYIAGENGYARCLDPATGEKHWKAFVGGINRGKKTGSYGSETSPAVADGEFYCATYDGELFNLDITTGKKRWIAKTGDDTDVSPVISGDHVFVAAQEKSPYLFCFAREDGRQIWKMTNRRGWWSTPAVVGDNLYIGGFNSRVYGLNARTGEPRWVKRLKSPTWASPAVVDDRVIIGDFDGKLWCLDAKTGDEVWVKKLGGRLHSTPVILNGRIYIGAGDGWFYCLG
ncbi:MAG: outer membrane protein assembly factor BamB [Myxococcota bacterium]|jgi:outer membrane protein assembly factor BamB